MSTVVRAIRGATTLDHDDADHLTERVQELVRAIYQRNDLPADDDAVVSVVLTATADISSKYPASAARAAGLEDVPLLGAQELTVDDMVPRCVRVLLHVNTTKTRADMHHVFLHGAIALRPDLAK